MKHIYKKRSIIFFLASTLIILLACMATLFWQGQHTQNTHAADISFVGAPTLPASTVDSILARLGSPMVGEGKVIEQAAQANNIDDAFALAVWNIETSEGQAGVGRTYLNPGGVRSSYGYPAGLGGYTVYPSYAAGIQDWFSIVKSRYVSRGLSSVYTLCVPYVGTSNSYVWAGNVTALMYRFRGETPPPAPTAVVQATAPPAPTAIVQATPTLQATTAPAAAQNTNKQSALQPQATPKSIQPVTPMPQTSSHPQVQPQQSGQRSPFILSTIILAALGIALSALLLGKRKIAVSVQQAVQAEYNPITPAPMLYTDQNAYWQELDTAPQIPAAQVELDFASVYAAQPPFQQATLSVSEYSVVPLATAATPVRGNLLRHYRMTESLDQEPASISGPSHEYSQPARQTAPTTEDLFYNQIANALERQPEPGYIPAAAVNISRTRSSQFRPRRLVPLPPENL